MSSVLADLRQSWRIFVRQPGLASAAVVALAMGIGFTTTMFSVLHGGTRSLPFDAPEQIVAVVETQPSAGLFDIAPGDHEVARWRQTLTSFAGLAAFQSVSVNVSGAGDPPERLSATRITPDAFGILGVGAARGRAFAEADAGPAAPPVVVLGHDVWRTRYRADPALVGQQVRLDGVPTTVIGVMPAGFGFPINADVWLPLRIDPAAAPGDGANTQVFGRLREGITPARATDELNLDLSRLAGDAPEVFAGRSGRVFPFTEIETPPSIRRALQLLVAVVSLVLLVACANVANLLLARAAGRSRDTAIRAALGASRRRLLAQHLAESMVLALAASVIGVAVAAIGLRFFAAASADILTAFWVDFRVDATVVAFASAIGLLAAVAAGLGPALRASSAGVGALLQSHSGRVAGLRIGRLGRGLVIAQIGLACAFLVVTSTFVGAAGALRLVPNPFPSHEILTAQLAVLPDVLNEPTRRQDLLRELRDGFAADPAFTSSAFVSVFPGRGAGRWSFSLPDRPETQPEPAGSAPALTTGIVMVTPEFFELAGVRPLHGRLLTWQDDEDAMPTALVNVSFAERYFDDATSPIGRRLALAGGTSVTIVGVVPDLLMQDVEDRDGAGIYLSMLQVRPFAVRLMARTVGPPLGATGALRRVVAGVDPDLPIREIATLDQAIFEDKRVLDAIAALFLCFGLGAGFMAVLGLHALLSFLVTARQREFGVRMALGASGREVVWLVVRRGGAELLWGLAAGLSVAVVLSRLVSSAVEQLPPVSLGVLLLVALTVSAGAAVATLQPLRRVLRLDPLDALRQE